MKLIDLHCDTVLKLYEDPATGLASNGFSIDLGKLRNVHSMAQVFALFIDQEKTDSYAKTAFAMLDRFRSELDANAGTIAWAGNGADIRKNEQNGKMTALIAIEEGGALEGSLENLRAFYDKGVRFITLTWNYPNEIGFPHGEEHGHKGLTPFGIELLAEMNRLGVVADVSHLSEGGFWDVAKHAKKPFMATHSNCRALKDHTRNLTDEQIRALAENGGVMGISVVKNFLIEGEDTGRLAAMVSHIEHARNVGGLDALAIGTDFDGTSTNHELRTIDDLNKLEPMLRKAGYTDDMLERIYWRNALRVIDDVLTFPKGVPMAGVIVALVVLFITGYLIISKAKAQTVLLCSGILLMIMGTLLGTGSILDKTTGSMMLDIFEKIKSILASRAGGLGLSIMAVGGYARYMDKIGASRAMVQVLSRPLKSLSSPYIVLAATYILGQIMAQFITSASGLGMLLMVTLYPTLINTGVSRLSAVAAIGTTMSIEWGILETNTIFASEVAKMPVSEYFMNYQVAVGCTVIIAIAITHFFVQRWFDSKMAPEEDVQVTQEKLELPPLYYAILPTLPLLLLVGYLFFDSREVHLVVVMMISVTVVMLVQFFHSFKLKETFGEIQSFFDGMGTQFANVVTLIVAGETFAHGLKTTGAVNAAIHAAESTGFGGIGVLIIMVLVIAGCAVVMGSGNAPFFSFADLIPNIAAGLSIPAVVMIMPMHFATSIARGMSPITAVIVVTSGIAGVSPFDVVKRTAIPLLVGLVVNVTATVILFY